MKKLVVAAAVIASALLLFYFVPNPGKVEFRKQIEALDTIKSWKMDLQVSTNGRLVVHRSHEAQCPDMEHIYEIGPENVTEYTRMSNLVYYRKNSLKWVQDSNTPQDLFAPLFAPRPCMSNPGGTTTSPDSGDTEWRTELKRAVKDGNFSKGEIDMVGGLSCRNWQVSWMNGRNQLVAYTMCINEHDHLPRRIQMLRENVNMYFTWNVPVEIKAPEIPVDGNSGPSDLYNFRPNSN